MFKKIFLLILASSYLYCEIEIDDVKALYNSKLYNRVCSLEVRDLLIETNDENLAYLYGRSCLNMDKINELILPIALLYKTKESRENAVYFSTILFQKKLLYRALIDGSNIENINLPKTNYILSVIFDKFRNKDYKFLEDKYFFTDENSDIIYVLYIDDENEVKKIVLEQYKNSKLRYIKRYW